MHSACSLQARDVLNSNFKKNTMENINKSVIFLFSISDLLSCFEPDFSCIEFEWETRIQSFRGAFGKRKEKCERKKFKRVV